MSGEHEVIWTPHEGPQRQFLSSNSYECLYGGAAGGGKTDALLYGLLRQTNHPQFKGLFLRESFPQLREVIDRAHLTYSRLGAEWKATEYRYHFPSGATIEFGYCAKMADTGRYQGQEFTEIAYDEIGLLADVGVWLFFMSRNRSTADGLVKLMRASANPGGRGHLWLKRRFVDFCDPGGAPTIDPKTGMTRAFIPALARDNPTLMKGDPDYVRRLNALPDLMRKQLLEGDWNAGEGAFFSELDPSYHLVPPVMPQPWWPVWSAFDWGFDHPFAAGVFTMNDDGQTILVDSAHGRRMLPDDIAYRLSKTLDRKALVECYAGHDCFAKRRAMGGDTPSIADTFAEHSIFLSHANIDRVLGWQTIMRLLTRRDSQGNLGDPKLVFADTPNNRKVLAVMQSLIADPDYRDDVLKADADRESGEGGDDAADMVRYGVATRVTAGRRPPVRRDPYEHDRDDKIIRPGADAEGHGGTFDMLPEGF